MTLKHITAPEARRLAYRLICARGLRIRHRHLPSLAPGVLAGLRELHLCGVPRRYSGSGGGGGGISNLHRLPPKLRILKLTHCKLPTAKPFWPEALAACPELEAVTYLEDFFVGTYAASVDHMIDLVAHGAPRLRHLDIEGSWIVMYPTVYATRFTGVREATARAYAQPPVTSSTLRHFRAACQQAPLGVDAPLDTLSIAEPCQAPFVVSKMGAAALSHTRSLTYKCTCKAFDASRLASFENLRELTVRIDSIVTRAHARDCLATLAHLPRSLRRLTLSLDIWAMRLHDDSGIEWGDEPLKHLDDLEYLAVEMLFPPASAGSLLTSWLGVPAGVRTVRFQFKQHVNEAFQDEIERLLVDEALDPQHDAVLALRQRWAEAMDLKVCRTDLDACMAKHPGATMHHNLPHLVAAHPRVVYCS